jgi:hypothetical protein
MKTTICINNLSYSQFNHEVFNYIDNFVEQSDHDISLIAMDQTMPFRDVNTAIFNISAIDSFNNGLMIANNIENAEAILSSSNNSKKVLILYDMEWMFHKMFYKDIYKVLSNKDLILISRHKDHSEIIKNTCNREPDAIIEKFDLEKIWNLL